jgi:hypothetical protein
VVTSAGGGGGPTADRTLGVPTGRDGRHGQSGGFIQAPVALPAPTARGRYVLTVPFVMASRIRTRTSGRRGSTDMDQKLVLVVEDERRIAMLFA